MKICSDYVDSTESAYILQMGSTAGRDQLEVVAIV